MDEKSCPNRVGQLFSCRFSAGGFRRRSLERQIARGACPPMVESRGGRRIAVELRVSAAGRSFAPRRPAVRVPLGRAPSQAPTRIGVVLRRRFGLVEAGGPKPPHAEARILSTRALRRLRPEHESRVSAAGRSFRFRTARQGVRRRVRGSPRCPWPCVRRRRPPNRNRGTRAVRPDRSAGR